MTLYKEGACTVTMTTYIQGGGGLTSQSLVNSNSELVVDGVPLACEYGRFLTSIVETGEEVSIRDTTY